MSNIELFNGKQNAYIVAFQSKKCSEMTTEDVLRQVRESIQLSHQRKGQTISSEDLGFQAADLVRVISNDFKFLRVDEISIALEKGVFGEYGEFFGLNSATYHNWIRKFLESQERAEKLKQKNMLQIEEPEEPSKAIRLQQMKSSAKKLFLEFKKSGGCNDVLNCVYNFLDRSGLVSISKEEKFQIFDLAKEKVLEEKRTLLSASNSMKRNEIKTLIERIEQNPKDKLVKSKAKQLALNHIFSKIENLEELEILLDGIE